MASTSSPFRALQQPEFPQGDKDESQKVIDFLKLQPHIEGGYFIETDRDATRTSCTLIDGQTATRMSSTSIFYLLDAASPIGAFHRNKGRTVHTLHRGRGRYVILHADEAASPSCPGGYGPEHMSEQERWLSTARIETFVVGQNLEAGERLQWIVEGGKYKCSFLLPDIEGGRSSEGLLISETVVPGFEYEDHDFMRAERMEVLLKPEEYAQMAWMLRKT